MLLYGMTGLWLQHRATLKIPGPKTEMISETFNLGYAFNSIDDFKYFANYRYPGLLNDTKVRVKESLILPTSNGSIVIPEMWSINYVGLEESINFSYVPETLVVRAKRQEPNFGAFMNRLHRGMGTGISWQLFGDLAAISLILFSLTGLFMWTKLHGESRTGVILTTTGTIVIIIITLINV